MKYLTEVIQNFLANLDREGMDCPAAVILTPKDYKRACAELGCGTTTPPAIELTSARGSVYLQAGVVQRIERPALHVVPDEPG